MRERTKPLGDKNLVGDKVTALRKQHNMKQKELLARLQVMGVSISASSLSDLERQIKPVTDKELVALADIFGITTDVLLGRPQ